MSALRSFAFGMLDGCNLSPREFRALREEVRAELRREKLDMQLKGNHGNEPFTVTLLKIRGEKGGKLGRRRQVLCHGSMKDCCVAILRSMGEMEI